MTTLPVHVDALLRNLSIKELNYVHYNLCATYINGYKQQKASPKAINCLHIMKSNNYNTTPMVELLTSKIAIVKSVWGGRSAAVTILSVLGTAALISWGLFNVLYLLDHDVAKHEPTYKNYRDHLDHDARFNQMLSGLWWIGIIAFGLTIILLYIFYHEFLIDCITVLFVSGPRYLKASIMKIPQYLWSSICACLTCKTCLTCFKCCCCDFWRVPLEHEDVDVL